MIQDALELDSQATAQAATKYAISRQQEHAE